MGSRGDRRIDLDGGVRSVGGHPDRQRDRVVRARDLGVDTPIGHRPADDLATGREVLVVVGHEPPHHGVAGERPHRGHAEPPQVGVGRATDPHAPTVPDGGRTRWYNVAVAGRGIEIVETVPARAALAGNPSDGYGGAVLAVPVPAVSARVVLRPTEHFDIDGHRFESLAAARAARDDRTLPGLAVLALAAVDAYALHLGPPPPSSVRVSTTIPAMVGLAGSSAVVIGVLRVLARSDGRTPTPDELAAIALAAEVDGVGIAAGPQDRLVQCHGRPMHMEFGGGPHEPVEPGRPLRLVVAYRAAAAAASGATHGPLRIRWERGDRSVRAAMAALAEEARLATAALRAGDARRLGASMDRSFELRRSIVPLDPTHVEMIDVARAQGAAANFAGSGGSITVLGSTTAVLAAARAALAAIGCRSIDVVLG